MKTRRVHVDEFGKKTIVWFGSYGINTELYISFNFNTAYSSQSITYSNFVERYGNNEYLIDLQYTNMRYGDSSQQNVTGLLLGTSSEDAVVTMTFNREIKSVSLYVTNYKNTTTSLIVNGETVYPTHSQYEEPEVFTFNVSGKVLVIESNDAGTPTDERLWLKRLVVAFHDNSAKFYNSNNKHDNYSTAQQGVVDNLIQKLSLIKGELQYDMTFGIPITDKNKSKASIDVSVMSIIMSNSDVIEITKFTSNIEKLTYHCNFEILTKYGKVEVNL